MPTTTAEQDQAAAAALDSFIETQQAAGVTVFKLGSDTRAKVEAIPTGALPLDIALGVGGIPRGRVVELYGVESGGKTSLALSITAQAQKLGLNVGFVDAEHALDPGHASTYGVDIDTLAFYQPDNGEAGLEMVRRMAESGAFGLIVIDSVAALTPRAEIEGTMDDQHVGRQARMMGQGLRMIVGAAQKSNCSVIFINQIREKVGVMMGNPETTPGGRALKFFSSVRLEVRSAAGDRIYDGPKTKTAPKGQKVKVKVVKNKVAPPMKRAEFDILYDRGVDVSSSLIESGKTLGLVELRSSSIVETVSGERLAIGKDNFRELCDSDPALVAHLTANVHRVLRGEEPQSRPAGDAPHTEGDTPDEQPADEAA